jgi:general secretion pathway protein D
MKIPRMKTTSRTFDPVIAPALFLLTACLFCPGQTSLSPSGPLLSPPSDNSNDSAGFSNFQNTPISSILDNYEQISGKHLIRDANIASIPNVSINATGVSKEEFLRLVESTLLLNGVAIVPVDDHTAKVVAMAGARNPRSEGVKIYANAEDIPKDDEVVSYYMPLSYINPAEAVQIFMNQAPVHPYGVYIPAPTAQAVIVTESTGVVRELIALKELIDVPPASVTSTFVQLTRADAEKVADLLNKLLEAKKDAANPQGGGPVSVPPNLGNEAPMLNEHDLLSGPAQIVADPRSNRILIVTRPVNLPFLEGLIAQLDSSDAFMQPQRRPLKYVLAQDILPALANSLAQGKDEQDEAKALATSAAGNNSNPVQGTNANSNVNSNGQGAPVNGAGSQSSPGTEEAALTDPPQNNVPTMVSIGKTRLLADNRSNSIIVFGTPDAVDRVNTLIDQLDRKPLQVYLAAVIGQLTVTEGTEFGIDILQKFQQTGSYGGATGLLNTPAGLTAAGVPEPSAVTSAAGFPLASGLTIYGAIGNTVNAYVRALETTNRFKVISRPSVYTTNNKAALIASGSQVPVPASTTSGFTGSSSDLVSTSSISYENVLLQLSIIPVINANHQITLRIRQSNDSIGGSQTISGNSIPIIDTQKLDTEVTVPDKSTIVIGGLISDNTERDTTGLPFLGDIPVLGYLFKDTKKTKTRTELIIMIQPTVVDTEADQIVVNEAEKARTILGKEAEESGAPTPPPVTAVVTQTRTTEVSPGGHGQPPVATTTTVTKTSPVTPSGSIVPEASTPAPDVGKARLPKDARPVPPPAVLP